MGDQSTSTDRLSHRQRRALAVVIRTSGRITPNELAVALKTSPEGAAQTASSLVNRGLLARHRAGRDGRVAYEVA